MTAPGPARPRVPGPYFALFVLLYAVQGVVFAYFINFNQTYMMAGGVRREAVGGVQAIALLPFVLKFLAGPLSDRFPLLGLGHRKPYILIGLVMQAAGLLLLAAIHPGRHLTLSTAVAFLTVAGLSLYDTCTDGMILDITPPADRSRVQGALMFARFFTATAFSLAFGYWLDRTGTGPGRGYRVLWTCSALTAIPFALMLRLPEPRRAADAEAFDWRALEVMLRPRSLVLLAYGAFYSVVAYGVEINLPVFYKDLGLTQGDTGLSGAARNLGRAFGALLLPVGTARLSRRWILRVGVLGLIATELAQAAVRGRGSAIAAGFAFGAANGWADATFYVLAMEYSDPRLAASTYALFMAVSNLSVTGGYFFSLATRLFGGDFRPTFVAAAAFSALALVLIRPLSRAAPGTAAPEEPAHAPAA